MSESMYEALLDSRIKVEEDMAEIRDWIARAIAAKYSGRGYTDQKTWSQKQQMLSAAKIEHQRINVELGRIRRNRNTVAKAEAGKRTETKREAFIRVCERRLTREMFESIWDDVEAELAALEIR